MPVLGKCVATNRRVELTQEARRQGVYVIGTTGTGKTTLLQNIAYQDMVAGDGLCVLDPHGDFIDELLLRVPDGGNGFPDRRRDVILFSPGEDEQREQPLGLNLFEYTFQGHDEMMAYSLALPFMSSMVFAACMKEKTVPGTTFAKHRAIAKGLLSEEDAWLAEVIFNPAALAELERVTSRLEFLKHVIRGRDFEEAKRFFDGLRDNVR